MVAPKNPFSENTSSAASKVLPIGMEQPEAWVVVHSAGVPLEPEYELAGIFETADAATAFTERSFSLDAETSALDAA